MDRREIWRKINARDHQCSAIRPNMTACRPNQLFTPAKSIEVSPIDSHQLHCVEHIHSRKLEHTQSTLQTGREEEWQPATHTLCYQTSLDMRHKSFNYWKSTQEEGKKINKTSASKYSKREIASREHTTSTQVFLFIDFEASMTGGGGVVVAASRCARPQGPDPTTAGAVRPTGMVSQKASSEMRLQHTLPRRWF